MVIKILGNLDQNYINNIIKKTKKIIRIPGEITFYFLENLNLCFSIKLPKNLQNRFKLECNQKVSFSVKYKSKKVIVVYVTKDLQANQNALIGLLLHEISHIKQIDNKIYNNIYSAYNEVYDKNLKLILGLNYDKTRLKQLFEDISVITTSTLKDIYANNFLIKKRLDFYLLKYYFLQFNNKVCPKPIFYKNLKNDINSLNLVFDFELSLLSIILPLYKTKKARILVKHIESCYEINIKEISSRCHELINLYFSSFNKKDFNKDFYNLVFLKVYYLLK